MTNPTRCREVKSFDAPPLTPTLSPEYGGEGASQKKLDGLRDVW
jgi:hypothetical protein